MDQNSEKILSEDIRDLHEVLTELKTYWKKQSSLRWNFVRGILYGFGFFIGSVLIAACLIYIISHIGVDSNSILGKLLNGLVDFVQNKR